MERSASGIGLPPVILEVTKARPLKEAGSISGRNGVRFNLGERRSMW